MGDIADMMLDGTLCEGCGVYMDGDSGFPRRCRGCARDYKEAEATMARSAPAPTRPVPKVACPDCGKRVGITGIGEHWKQKHSKAL